MNNNNNNESTSKGEQGKSNVSDAKLSEGLALVGTVLATVKANYETDLAATSALGRWVKATTAGKRGSKVTLNDLVKAFDGKPGTSKGALSKAMTVAGTTAAQRKDYLTNAGERPTVDGLYLSVRTVQPRTVKSDAAATADALALRENAAQSAAIDAATFTDDMVSQVAREFVAGLRTRGASTVQINLVIAELDRLTTPISSVKAAA